MEAFTLILITKKQRMKDGVCRDGNSGSESFLFESRNQLTKFRTKKYVLLLQSIQVNGKLIKSNSQLSLKINCKTIYQKNSNVSDQVNLILT